MIGFVSLVLSGALFVVDPGHGTRYPDGRSLNVGAVSKNGIRETAVTLAIGERLAALLRERGAKVVLTRSFLQPYASLDSAVRGTSVFWLKANGATLANAIRHRLAPLELGESQFRARDLAVTSEATVPAVLVELGFITNPVQARALTDPAFQEREATALADALGDWFRAHQEASH
jgi:N-acetylmuramoyl-L-alanine amidase